MQAPSVAEGCIVASSSCPVATKTALDCLEDGGNAFDGVIAAAGVLFNTLPMSCGPGGDAVLIGYEGRGGRRHCFAGIGRAPAAATIEHIHGLGLAEIPTRGVLSATIPQAWHTLHAVEQVCTKPLAELLEPGHSIAIQGVSPSPQCSRWILNNKSILQQNEDLAAQFLSRGSSEVQAPEIIKNEALAQFFNLMRGDRDRAIHEISANLLETSGRENGLFSLQDFITPTIDKRFVSIPLSTMDVMVPAPPTQGILILQALSAMCLLEGDTDENLADQIHLWSEIFNQVYALRLAHLSDPDHRDHGTYLDINAQAKYIASSVNKTRRSRNLYSEYKDGDTTQIVVGDRYGGAASLIISLSHGFGAGVRDTNSGILFNQRLGRSASLTADAANALAPSKRPVNTLTSFLVTDAQGVVAIGGTPGGDGQIQWNSVVLHDAIVRKRKLETIVQQPRFTYLPGGDTAELSLKTQLHVDRVLDDVTVSKLSKLGHTVVQKRKVQGCIRMIGRMEKGGWCCGDDGHEDGLTLSRG